VPARARACPECGADERAGWNEAMTRYDDVDLPEEAFEHDEVLRDESSKARHRPNRVPLFWWLVGIGLLVVIISMAEHYLN
jgi:hypothetical protein